jgi:penicillin-binding protein 2
MTELRNVEADLSRFRVRVLVASIVVVVAFLLLASRLVYLQVVRHQDLSEQAENNRTSIVPVVPNRGLILDRNGIVLATNYSAYTLEIMPARLPGSLDKTIEELSHVINIEPRDKRRFKKLLEESRPSSRCRSAPSSPKRKWPVSPPRVTGFPASTSRPACSAAIRGASSPAT